MLGRKRKVIVKRIHMNVKKGETNEKVKKGETIERRPDCKRHRTVSTSSSISALKQVKSMEIVPLRIKLKENEQGNNISKVTSAFGSPKITKYKKK